MNSRTLIVGTTDDYIKIISDEFNQDVFFLTDSSIREKNSDFSQKKSELVCDLTNISQTLQLLKEYINKNNIIINGIASFDCESLELASTIAETYYLPYPSLNSIKECRNKLLFKKILLNYNIKVPLTDFVSSEKDLIQKFKNIGCNCVLKPVAGSGSELVFLCTEEEQCLSHYKKIIEELKLRRNNRLFNSLVYNDTPVILEQYIRGREYSCDFVNEDNEIFIIRLSEKITLDHLPFGISAGYKIIRSIEGIKTGCLKSVLNAASTALELNKTICMADFIINNGEIYLLEITPRPGGDCIPDLFWHCTGGHSTISSCVSYSSTQYYPKDSCRIKNEYIALRLFADKKGVLQSIDFEEIKNCPQVLDIKITKNPGDIIDLPPADYDSWCLGHVIYKDINDYENEYKNLTNKIKVSIIK